MSSPHKLHALCPYFAMFPPAFAQGYIEAFTSPGDLVLDPFCGRGTTLLETLLLGRSAVALDVNPVAVCVTGAKAETPSLPLVRAKVRDLKLEFEASDKTVLRDQSNSLPQFFSFAFHPDTLQEILFLRNCLEWRRNHVDRFVMALALGSLHGEMETSPSYFSNQMPRTISTKPTYSIKYWCSRGFTAQRRAVFQILENRAELRLRSNPIRSGISLRADARDAHKVLPGYEGQIKAVVTSPPYLNVTNFEEDQWLRLWLLGGPPHPTYRRVSRDDRHSSASKYWKFLSESIARSLSSDES